MLPPTLMYPLVILCAAVLPVSAAVHEEYFDAFTGKEINQTRYEDMRRIGLVPICATRVNACDPHELRRMDLSCNNLHHPTRGTAFTPFIRMLPPIFGEGGAIRRAKSGNPLPLARPLRVALMSDGRRPHRALTHMIVNFMVFITGDTTSVHDTVNYVVFTRTCCEPGGELNPQCNPIRVPDDDIHLRRSNVRCLNLTRAITYQDLGCVPDTVALERINLAAPMLELSGVYGHDEPSARRGRAFKGGRMRADVLNGKEWPPTGGQLCVNNEAPNETRCHDSPSPGANSLLGINLVFLWFYRSHNAIADRLKKENPCWDDNRLYLTAREINIAYCAHIMYYEVLPMLFGWDYLLRNKLVFDTKGHVNDYDPSLEPRLSIEYTTVTRWFHTLQEGTLNLYKPDGRLYGSVQVVDMILRTGALPLNGNIEGMTQGSFRQPGAALDDVVDPDVGERILGRLQLASDVISSDIMKGRDFGLPPYNNYRKACGLPVAKKFKDLLGWMGRQQVEAMATFYEHPDDIDLMAGLLAEKPMEGAQLSPTLACIMAEQLLRWRRADRFWFENDVHPGAFTPAQLHEVRKMSMAKIVCQHGDGVHAVQPEIFLLPGHGNEITACSEYDMPNLSVFRDDRCYPHPTNKMGHSTPPNEEYSYPTSPYQRQYYPNSPYEGYNQNNPPYEQTYPTSLYDVNGEQSMLKDYISKIFNTHQKSLSNHPNTFTYKNEGTRKNNHDHTTTITNGNYLKYDHDYTFGGPNDQTIKHGHENPTTHRHVDTTRINEYDPNLGHKIDTTTLFNEFDPKLGHKTTDGKDFKPSSLFPTETPDVQIYPNADPIESNHKLLKVVTIPNEKINSNAREESLYSVHSALRNQNNPFEEFLQNYWQSTKAY